MSNPWAAGPPGMRKIFKQNFGILEGGKEKLQETRQNAEHACYNNECGDRGSKKDFQQCSKVSTFLNVLPTSNTDDL